MFSCNTVPLQVKAYKLGTLSPVNVGSQSAVAVVGRICTEEEGEAGALL